MLTLPFRSAKQLASLIRRKKFGCLELLDLYLQRIERYNSEINAVIFMDIEAARNVPRPPIRLWPEAKYGDRCTDCLCL